VLEIANLNMKVRKLREVLVKDPESVTDPRWATSFKLMQAEARGSIPGLEVKMEEAFAKVGFPVFVDGPVNQKLVDLTKAESPDVVGLDAAEPYRYIYELVKASIGKSSTFGPSQFMIILREVRSIAAEHGIASLPDAKATESVFVGTDAALKNVIEGVISDLTSNVLLPVVLQRKATRVAEALDLNSPVVPVYLFNAPQYLAEKLGPKMFQGKHLWINPKPEEVTSKYVIQTLTSIKKTLKNKE
jgi:hypothetical protein